MEDREIIKLVKNGDIGLVLKSDLVYFLKENGAIRWNRMGSLVNPPLSE